jgi:hypothetical protein
MSLIEVLHAYNISLQELRIYLHYLHHNLIRAQNDRKLVETDLRSIAHISTVKQNLHHLTNQICQWRYRNTKQLVEMYTHNISTKGSLNLVPFDKISKSGDGGRGGGYLHNPVKSTCYNESSASVMSESKDTWKSLYHTVSYCNLQ